MPGTEPNVNDVSRRVFMGESYMDESCMAASGRTKAGADVCFFLFGAGTKKKRIAAFSPLPVGHCGPARRIAKCLEILV